MLNSKRECSARESIGLPNTLRYPYDMRGLLLFDIFDNIISIYCYIASSEVLKDFLVFIHFLWIVLFVTFVNRFLRCKLFIETIEPILTLDFRFERRG